MSRLIVARTGWRQQRRRCKHRLGAERGERRGLCGPHHPIAAAAEGPGSFGQRSQRAIRRTTAGEYQTLEVRVRLLGISSSRTELGGSVGSDGRATGAPLVQTATQGCTAADQCAHRVQSVRTPRSATEPLAAVPHRRARRNPVRRRRKRLLPHFTPELAGGSRRSADLSVTVEKPGRRRALGAAGLEASAASAQGTTAPAPGTQLTLPSPAWKTTTLRW